MSVPAEFTFGTEAHVLLHLMARRRSDGEPVPFGVWTGADHRDFVVDGAARSYLGAGLVIAVAPVRASLRNEVVVHRVALPPLRDEVRAAMALYDLHQAGAELHVVALQDHVPIWMRRLVRGVVDRTPSGLTREGGQVELEIVSAARKGTFGLPLFRSSEQLRRRAANDSFRDDSDVAGEWRVPWGQ